MPITPASAPPHPAKYSPKVLDQIGALVRQEHGRRNARAAAVGLPPVPVRVLDPFAGVGGIHALASPDVETTGVELEPEWAAAHARTQVGDALALPRAWTEAFDVVATSPCYGNRMADHHDARDESVRHTYRHALGRMPSPTSAATMGWGARYREFHTAAWEEVERVVKRDGLFILNVSDHVAGGAIVPVAEWHLSWLLARGWLVEAVWPVSTRRLKHGANANLRVGFELVAALRRGEVMGAAL